jgi:hypothetical protein
MDQASSVPATVPGPHVITLIGGVAMCQHCGGLTPLTNACPANPMLASAMATGKQNFYM